jgi:ankyrin repeat protein
MKVLGADVDQREGGEHERTALVEAAYLGQHATVRYLVEELGADINTPDNKGLTPLYVASLKGHLAVV